MTDPIWLDGYTGQSVDQLLALEGTHRIDSLVLAFEEALGKKAALRGDDSLSDEERVVLAIEALEREVNNGGYSQFFVNTPEYASIVVDALRRIGCSATADITQAAVDALDLADLSPGAIDTVMATDNETRNDKLSECDGRYYESGENIADRLFAFILANKAAINLN